MDNSLLAYDTGRRDGIAQRRDPAAAADPATGADYRIGFLDGRIEVFRLLAHVRKIVEDADDWPHR